MPAGRVGVGGLLESRQPMRFLGTTKSKAHFCRMYVYVRFVLFSGPPKQLSFRLQRDPPPGEIRESRDMHHGVAVRLTLTPRPERFVIKLANVKSTVASKLVGRLMIDAIPFPLSVIEKVHSVD